MISKLDIEFFRWLNSWAGINPLWDALIIFGAVYLSYVVVAVIFFFAAFSAFPKFKHLFKRNIELFIFAIASGIIARYIVTFAVRFFYDRPRPFEVVERVYNLVSHTTGGSFPSGHASAAFAIATAVSFYYPKTSILFFLAALSVGLGRIAAGVHWPSDILGGAITGIGTAWLVRFLYQKHTKNPGSFGRML